MAKPAKRVTAKQVSRKQFDDDKSAIIPEKYQDMFYVVSLILLIYIFFWGAISGGGFNVSDNVSSASFHTYRDVAAKAGEFPLWLPYIFCGIPGYAALLTSGPRMWDVIPQVVFSLTEFIGAIFASDLARVLSFFALYGIGMYILMRFKNHTRYVAFFTAFAAVFSTSVIVWPMIGHNTKPIVFAMFPYIIILLEKLRLRFSLLYAALLVFAVHFMMAGQHMQMIFYGICAFGLYLLFELVSRLILKQEPMKVVRAGALLAVAGGLAFLMSADRYLSTMEYTPYSTRGSAPLVKAGQTQDQKGGNDYDYATMWSFSPQEVMTFFVPNYFGFGQLDYQGPLTGERKTKMRSYWGQKPFEDAAPYMGITVLALAFLGAVKYRRDVFVQFLIALSVFALFLSFGKTLPVLYDLFFYNVPSFNKFRAPSMALALVQFAVPILAGYGLSGVFDWRKNFGDAEKKSARNFVIATGIFLVIGLIFSALFKGAYNDAVAGSSIYRQIDGSYGAQAAGELQAFIWSEMISDWFMTGAIAVVSGIALFLFASGRIKRGLFFGLFFFLLLFDLWRVGYRPMEYAEKNEAYEKTTFARTDVIDFLQSDKSVFRIADFASPSPNVPAYFLLETVNGYHSAKLRVFQDMLDVIEGGSTSNVSSPFLWNLMNVKYIVTDRPLGQNIQPVFESRQKREYVYFNGAMLPRAFFVDSIGTASGLEILNHMKNSDFSPRQLAYLESKPGKTIDKPLEGAYAKVVNKRNHLLGFEVNATGNNFLYVSEIYYPVGWKAYIDNKETEIYKTNFAFRGVIVPQGKHTLEFRFHSDKFEQGKTLSLGANVLTLLVLAGGIFFEIKRSRAKKQ